MGTKGDYVNEEKPQKIKCSAKVTLSLFLSPKEFKKKKKLQIRKNEPSKRLF
jgi:hypothetical protein